MKYVTIIKLNKLSGETKRKILEACKYCSKKDKQFIYHTAEQIILIESMDKDIAYKRGSYFHKKYGAYYTIIKEQNK